MKFIITKEIQADTIAEAFNLETRGQGEVVDIYKAKDQAQQPVQRLDVGFKTTRDRRKQA